MLRTHPVASPAASLQSHKILRLKAQTRSSWAPSCLWLRHVTLRPVYPDGHFSVCLSVCLSAWLSVCLPVCMSACLSLTARLSSPGSTGAHWAPTANQHLNIKGGPGCKQFSVWGVKSCVCVCVFMDVSLNGFSQGVTDSWYQFQCNFALKTAVGCCFLPNLFKIYIFYARKTSRTECIFSLRCSFAALGNRMIHRLMGEESARYYTHLDKEVDTRRLTNDASPRQMLG